MSFKIGHSYDVHPLEKGKKLILGGITIPSEYGAVSHSDGDCVLHAVAESIIGALGLGDLGTFFPDTDDKYKGIDSSFFIKEVKGLLIKNNFKIANIDITIQLEKPALGIYKSEMEKKIAQFLNITVESVNVKATRGEKLGFIGRKEGVAATAIVLLAKGTFFEKL